MRHCTGCAATLTKEIDVNVLTVGYSLGFDDATVVLIEAGNINCWLCQFVREEQCGVLSCDDLAIGKHRNRRGVERILLIDGYTVFLAIVSVDGGIERSRTIHGPCVVRVYIFYREGLFETIVVFLLVKIVILACR